MAAIEGSNPAFRPHPAEPSLRVDIELGDEDDELLHSPHPHPHFSQRAPWLRAGVLGVCIRSIIDHCTHSKGSSRMCTPAPPQAHSCNARRAGLQASDGLVSVASLMLGTTPPSLSPPPRP